ncbi:MAG: hypothetical protein E5Y04_30795 [Mesorhizobium sp.]|uniref:hypothetical protein n=1 Tax=unclassified Mesorhizobium TaxID=325217 RepID=UPI000FCCBB29|nr:MULTISPECIES: hypothetical protein [unclassified Mesorhizobium]RUV37268.1 hypothetical protein EOB49_12715 [Mesorhizobium sp. M7A.F.Ca.MR.148.00.0.0]TJV20794.1 MAG: hypothetical protein E5Y04_30795 [Mesorhizobium sp.]
MALMKKQLLSFRDFLKTGSLGPISPDMTMAEIVEVLGMPEHVDPDYWTFGKLEISFDITPPRQMNWFQIEQASYLKGDLEALTTRFALSLDGFSGKTKPSEFLGAGLWTPDQAKVFYAASGHDIGMNICAGPIQIHFHVAADFIGNQDAETYLKASSPSQAMAKIDSRAVLDSIYSYPYPKTEEVPGAFDWKLLSGSQYLALADGQQTSANKKGARRPL